MNTKPNIPKQLASKIRGAQYKVTSARYDVIYDKKRIKEDSKRISEYDANPSAFAKKYYGNHSFDSYPVQTNISRCRESLEYRNSRIGRSLNKLLVADANLKQVEEAVLMRMAKLRPGTPGREPWPTDLPSFKEFHKIDKEQSAEIERKYAAQQIQDEIDLKEEDEIFNRQKQIEEDEVLREWKEQFMSMSPDEQAADRVLTEKFRAALKSGEITFSQLLTYAKSQNEKNN